MKRIFTTTIIGLLTCLLLGTMAAVSYADYGYYADRLSREHRIASDVDEWIERGNATITASPIFEDGARLTAWANTHRDVDNFEFAIASGVYLFEIPRNAQSIEILVRYKGEPNKLEIDDFYEPIAGRVWVRNIKREITRRGYNDQNASETRYGDTFVLRAKNRSETIKIPAAGHVEDGWMELHIVAEGGEQLDVEYIEVTTYRRAPKVRVVRQWTPTYRWRPWHRYTYLYFYDGPLYYSTGYDSYLCWSYPVYDHRYLSIRAHYGGYLGRYRSYHPTRYAYYHTPYHIGTGYYGGRTVVHHKKTQLNRWSAQHETTRTQYTRSRSAAPSGYRQSGAEKAQRTKVHNDVRRVIENHRRQAPPSTERITRSAIITQKRRILTRAPLQQNDPNRTYSSRYMSSRQTMDKQRRLIPNSRTNLNTDRRSTSSIYRQSGSDIGRSSQLYRRSFSTSNRTSPSSSSRSRSSSSVDRTKQRTPSVSTRTTTQRTPTVSQTPSSSSRTRTATKSRTTSRTSSSSDDDDDDDNSSSRSRTSERIKRRR